MLTMRTKYALKALGCLAKAEQGRSLLAAEIAEREKIPRKFLDVILCELKQLGFVTSRRGRGGGYRLASSPKQLTIGAVLRALEGPIAPVTCLARTADEPCAGCSNELTCGIRLLLKGPYEAAAGKLDKTTFSDMVRRIEQAEKIPAHVPRYSI